MASLRMSIGWRIVIGMLSAISAICSTLVIRVPHVGGRMADVTFAVLALGAIYTGANAVIFGK